MEYWLQFCTLRQFLNIIFNNLNFKTMKIMKFLNRTFLLIALLVTTVAFSQTKELTADQLTERMKIELSLTEDQLPKVNIVNEEFVKAMQVVKSSSDSKMGKLKVLKSADEKRVSSLKSILTNEQFIKFERTRKENREEMKSLLQGKIN